MLMIIYLLSALRININMIYHKENDKPITNETFPKFSIILD